MVVCVSILYPVTETLWVIKTHGYFSNSAYQYTIQQYGKIFEHIYVMCMFVFILITLFIVLIIEILIISDSQLISLADK